MRTQLLLKFYHCCAPLLFLLFISSAPRALGAPGVGGSEDRDERVAYAVWYRVPQNSLAHRRAKGNEFTAAHNRLPLGTLVCVTRISNGESVLVRITDRGITNGRATIDLCKEAAEQLGMIRQGFSAVRLEIVEELPAATTVDQNQVAAH